MLQAGDCYLVATNTDSRGYEVQHLHIILLDGEEYTKNTIVVPICSYDSDKQDKTILLQPGEHAFIIKVSYVNYRRATVRSLADVQRLIDGGNAKQKIAFDQSILKRICEGILRSPHTPNDVKQMYSHYLFGKLKKS